MCSREFRRSARSAKSTAIDWPTAELQRARSKDAAGLGLAAPLPRRARRDRRHRLGGKTKTYELQVDFNKLIAYGLTLPQLLQAVSKLQYQCRRQHRQYRGAIRRGARRRTDRSIDDLASTMCRKAAAIRAGQGYRDRDHRREARLGIAGLDQDDDIVQGIVLMSPPAAKLADDPARRETW